jgi:HSP20 family protein
MMSTTISKREDRGMRAWEPFQALRDEVESLWPQFFGERVASRLMPFTVPPADVSETPDAVKVEMDLPGFKASEIDVQLNNGVLTVSGERFEEKRDNGEKHHRIERRSGSFSRSLTLPAPVSEKDVDAHYRDGVLTIVMPKTADAKSRKIKVNG